MGGHALAKTKQVRILRAKYDRLIEKAKHAYKAELLKSPSRRRGLRSVCNAIQVENCRITGEDIKIDHNTLLRRLRGVKSLADERISRGWLKEEENTIILEYATAMAARGWPLSLRRLKEHADCLLRSRLAPEDFPEGGVGHNWAGRFVEINHTSLQMYYSRALDSSRGRAVNPATHKAWFDILEGTLSGRLTDGEPIDTDLIYGADECGIMRGCGQREKVVGSTGKTVQHQNRSGDRENTTVLAVVCADGSTTPPAVIVKGRHFLVSWHQDNPLDAS
jgi:hypothetical protein